MPPCENVPATSGPSDLPRVLIASLLRGTGATGVETHCREVSDYLTRLGGECEAVTAFSFPPVLRNLLFAPRRLLARRLPGASVAWYRWTHRFTLTASLQRQLRDGSPAVIYAQCPVSADAALRARCTKHQKVVLAVHFHGSQADEWTDRNMLSPTGRVYRNIRRFEERVIPAVDGHVFVSNSARQGLARMVSGIGRVPSARIPNFLRDTQSTQSPSNGRTADLVTIGCLEPHKNHHYLLEVLAAAAEAGHSYSLDIIGHGSLLRDLSYHAEALGLASKVRFLGWHDDPRSLLPGYKVYVHSSVRETGPLAVIEAMSVGLPVIAPSVGEVPKILGDGRCGAIWPLDDAQAAAELLISLLSDREALARMSRASRDRFFESYSTEQVASRLVAFFAEVAERSGSSNEPHPTTFPVALGTAMPA